MSATSLSAINSDGQLAKYFVNAEEARAKFEETLAAKNGLRILDIEGGVGYGKSALLKILRARCSRDDIPVALANSDSAKEPIGVLESLAQALSQSGISMSRFDPLLTKYQAVRRSATEHAPGQDATGGGARPAVFSEGMVDALSILPVQPEDVELYSEGVPRLTAAFLWDLQAAPTCIVLLIDRWEMYGSGNTRDWFRELLPAMPSHVRVVLAGGEPLPAEKLWSETWPTWTNAVLSHKMNSLNQTDAHQLIKRFAGVLTGDKAAPNSELAETMWRWSYGIPALLCFAVRYWHTQGGQFDVSQALVVRGAYDRLLLRTPPDLRSVLETAAILRFFTRKTLWAVAEPGQTEAALGRLFESAFLEPKGERWTVVEHLRDFLNGKLRVDDPERLAELHRKAGDYCETRGSELSVLPQSDQSLKELLEWRLERLYHRFEENQALGLATFRLIFEDAFFRRRDFADCSAIWNDFSTYALSPKAKQLARYYEGLTAIYRENDPRKPAGILEALAREMTPNDTLRADVLEYLAAIYWYYNQLGEGGTEKARQLYEECMALREANGDNAGLARVKIWVGILAQRAHGEGKSWFDQALELCKSLPEGRDAERIRGFANQELSIRDRMAGRFKDSEDKIKSAIKTFQDLQMPFDAAGAQFNYAMLLIWRGRLRQAEERLNAIDKLYQQSPRSRIQENSWIKIGFGNIALGRFQFEKAIELFSFVDALGKEKEDRFVESLGLGGLAECSIVEGRWGDALEFGAKCLALQTKSTDKFGAGWSLHIMGLAEAGKGNFDEALKHLDNGLNVMGEYGSWFGQARLLSAKCQVYAQKSDREQFWKAAEALREMPGDRFCDYLAPVAFAEGRLALAETKPKREVGLCFAEALQAATEYSPFLGERMLTDLLALLKEQPESSRNKVVSEMLAEWVRLDTKQRERERQGEEYEAQKERISLIDRIQREYPGVKAAQRHERSGRSPLSSGASSGGDQGGKVPVEGGTPKNGGDGGEKPPDGQAGVLVTLTKVAGIAGLAGGLFFMLFAKLAFPTLDARQATLFMILAYSFGALLLVVAAARSQRGGRMLAALLAALSFVMLVIGVFASGSSAPGVYTVAVTVRSPSNSLVEDAQISCSPPCNPKKVAGGWEIPIAGEYAKTKREIRVLAEVPDRGWQSETGVQLGSERFQTVKLQLQEQGELPVRGVVVDSAGNGIPNARVGRYGEPTVNTDQNGGFVLNTHAAKDAKVKLRAAKEPYAPAEVEYPVGSDDLKITLQNVKSQGATQRGGRRTQPQTVEKTGDKVIDDVLANLAALKQNGHVPTESELSNTLAPLFSRPAFYRGIREEEDWRYFLYPLCRTRQLLEQYVDQFKSNSQVRQNLSQAIQKMAALEARVAGLYGPTFTLRQHIDLYIGNKKSFIDHLPAVLNQPSSDFLDERDREIHEIRELVRAAGFPIQTYPRQ